ncbi:MAG: hypothetical protein ABUK01_01910 [Leptospirales bacterium]
MNIKKIKAIILVSVFFGYIGSVVAVPPSQKAKEKTAENQKFIVGIEVAILNFGTEDQKKEFEVIKNDYLAGLSLFLERNYVDSYKTQLATQQKLEKLFEQMSLNYIERTSTMLQRVIKNFVDLRVKFDKNSELVRRYGVDIDPGEARSYDPTEFHLTYDRYTIFRNIEMGYERLTEARRIRKAGIDLEKWFEDGKKPDPRYHAMRIERYLAAINYCRKSKLNVVRIYQLLNRNDIYTVQTDLRDNRFAVEANMPPVLDPRIPEEFKRDASDAKNLVYDKEVEVKTKKTN